MFEKGQEVIFYGEEAETYHNNCPEFYPVPDTTGIIDFMDEDCDAWVQWPKGSTSENDIWAAPDECLKPKEATEDV